MAKTTNRPRKLVVQASELTAFAFEIFRTTWPIAQISGDKIDGDPVAASRHFANAVAQALNNPNANEPTKRIREFYANELIGAAKKSRAAAKVDKE